jgi:hypothetical protein
MLKALVKAGVGRTIEARSPACSRTYCDSVDISVSIEPSDMSLITCFHKMTGGKTAFLSGRRFVICCGC